MKKATIVLLVIAITFIQSGFAQEKFQLSSHILDITTGTPAEKVLITLSRLDKEDRWVTIDKKSTDNNGRVNDFLKVDGQRHAGIYKLTFHTGSYFKRSGIKSFYPFIEVVFELVDDAHYHVPITLSPFGYSTYRGN